jgi:hypothetical protein
MSRKLRSQAGRLAFLTLTGLTVDPERPQEADLAVQAL